MFLLPRVKLKPAFNRPNSISDSPSDSMSEKHKMSFYLFSKDRPVILESPALPVLEGAAVILHCKDETHSSDHVFNYNKDGHHIGSSSTGEMTILRASKSDEGLYKCSISGGGESVESWLAVEGEITKLLYD